MITFARVLAHSCRINMVVMELTNVPEHGEKEGIESKFMVSLHPSSHKEKGGNGVEKLKNERKFTSRWEGDMEYFWNIDLGIVHKTRKVVSCNNYCEYAMTNFL
jgi:hypothetical protein